MSEGNKLFNKQEDFLDEEVNEKDICFWIDPLDGTHGFVNGFTEHITCNIGLTIKGKPMFGVIGKPFLDEKRRPLTSMTYVGGIQIGMHQIIHKDIKAPNTGIRGGKNTIVLSSAPIYRGAFC